MTTWLIVALAAYVLIVIGFIVAIYREAPKHRAQIGVLHYIVAILWPAWLIWYLGLLISEWWNRRK